VITVGYMLLPSEKGQGCRYPSVHQCYVVLTFIILFTYSPCMNRKDHETSSAHSSSWVSEFGSCRVTIHRKLVKILPMFRSSHSFDPLLPFLPYSVEDSLANKS
jgi:hypothetical protein